MDALTFLRDDHKSVLGLLERLDQAPTAEGSRVSGLDSMVTTLIIAESQHEAIEEQWFWPAVRRALDDGDALADKAIQQEQEGKRLLQQLKDSQPGQPHYQEALQAFVAAGRAHIDFEQNEVFPKFEAAVSRDELEKIGRQLETAKKVAPTRPHPGTPPSSLLLKTAGMLVAVVDHVRDALTGRTSKNPPDPQMH
ncbi:hemerythrin domain-containing protein [Mycobacterium sp.]|uniref:hemerythrin domain-containing protein n=1 Tax=Mycobacterium sp. TaxID=1785 RepID=UPI0025F362B9|nr:hemerythrin domain-containing protein [Mycobacterium sp.]